MVVIETKNINFKSLIKIYYLNIFQLNLNFFLSEHLSIQIRNILIQINIESKYPSKHFYQS
jgi:hypothetical protein